MGLPPNPIGARLTGNASAPATAATALPPNPLKGLVSPVAPQPLHYDPAAMSPSVSAAPAHPAPVMQKPIEIALGLTPNQRVTPWFPGQKPNGTAIGHPIYTKPDMATGYDPATQWTPEQQAQAEHLRHQNLGEAAVIARAVVKTGADLTGVPQGIRGVARAAKGVGEVAQGKYGRGARDVGVGGLSAATILPVGHAAGALRDALGVGKAVTRALKAGNFARVRDIAAQTAPSSEQAMRAAVAAFKAIPHEVFRQIGVTPEEFARHLQQGASMRYWYEESAHGILQMAGGNKNLADKYAQVTAIMSAQKEPLPNIQLANRAIHEFQTYGRVISGDEYQAAKATAVLRGEKWDGVKTDRFYKNMLEEINPRKYKRLFGNDEVTNDIWMARLYGLKSDVPTPREYEAMTQATQAAAKELGWKPKQVQAAQWVSKKAESEPRAAAGGASTFADALALEHARIPFEAAPGREPPLALGHVRLYRGEPVMPPRPPAEDRVANADYALHYPVVPKRGTYFTPDRATAESFARNANNGYPGQLVHIDVPKHTLENEGRNSQYVLPQEIADKAKPVENPMHAAYEKLSPQKQEAYASAKAALVRQYLREADVMGHLSNSGPGVFEGEVNPGRSVDIAASRARGPYKESEIKAAAPEQRAAMREANRVAGRTVHPETRAALDREAATIGHALNQDAAVWHKPFFVRIAKKDANGVRLDLGHTITPDEARALDAALRDAGHEGIAIVHHANGADILKTPDSPLSNAAFHAALTDAADRAGISGKAVPFAWDGNYIDRSEYASHLARPDGRGSAGDGSGGADLQLHEGRRADALSRLVAGSAAVDRQYLGAGGFRARLADESGQLDHVSVGEEPGYGSNERWLVARDPQGTELGRQLLVERSGRDDLEGPFMHAHGKPLELRDMYVQPHARGQGVARALLEHVRGLGRPVYSQFENPRFAEFVRREYSALKDESGQVDLGAIHDAISPPVVRTPEEAHTHLLEAAAQARAEGFGGGVGGKGHPPIVEKGTATDETGGELGQKIREALSHASTVRAVQKEGYSEERTARVRAASEASRNAGGGMTGHLAAKRHLAGELPKEFFGHLKDFTPEQLHEAAKVIDRAPMQFFEKTRAKDALAAMVNDGVVPNESDHALLERVFGRVAGTAAPDEKLATFWDKFVSVLNIPRALRSSGDISNGFRQSLVVLVTHPKVWMREYLRSIRSFGSEEYYRAQSQAILDDPHYPLALKYGVPFSDLEGNVPAHEEAFVGAKAAEHLPLGVGKVVRMSDRAFTGMANGTRMQTFNLMLEKAAMMGHDFTNANPNAQHLGESIARVVGAFTGRGTVPHVLEGHLTTLNAAMFSPRLMAARMNLLSPVFYAKLDPFARREALAGARNVVAAVGATMVVAKLLGAQVTFDPRSSNFAKIKVGNTRIDIAGGFSQYVRFIAQEITREEISSAGHHAHIGWGQHDVTDLANGTKLFRSKAGPIPSLLWDETSGKDFIGHPISQTHELWSNAPFVAQDAVDAYQKSGPASVPIAAFLSAIGLGVQSYKDKPQGRPTPKGGGAGLPPLPPLPALPALPRTP